VSTSGYRKSLDELQEAEIQRILEECSGNVSKAAKILGVGRATLYRRIGSQKRRKIGKREVKKIRRHAKE
jgi:transcriptional regulator of acetoin/glycerol metabolism